MAITSAHELAQRALDYNLIDRWQLQTVWGELGSSNVGIDELRNALLKRDLLTFFQIEHLIAEDRQTFFYGDYKILYLVGTGTFARVYRAADVKEDQQAAIKALRNRYSEVEKEAERFYREGQMGMSLRHPNIVPIYEVGTEGQTPYLVIEFIEGRNLRDFIKVRKMLDPAEATKLVLDICQGLDYAHQHGVFHRDLKLSNVLVSTQGVAKLVDFGLAGADENVSDDVLVKNPNPRAIDYAGLERATGVRKNDPRSDLFFVGCIYYHLLSGHPPLMETRDRMKRLARSRYRDIPSITEFNRDLVSEYAAVVNKAMQFAPDRRYQTPGEMAADLKRLLEEKPEQRGSVGSGANNHGDSNATQEEDAASREGLDEEGNPRKLMIVESDVRMQNLFRDRFKRSGYRVLVTSDPARAVVRLRQEKDVADLVLFSTGDLGEAALNAFNELAEHPETNELSAVLLLGDKHQGWRSRTQAHGGRRAVVAMPLKWRQLREALVNVLYTAE